MPRDNDKKYSFYRKFDRDNIKSTLPKFSYTIKTMLLNKIKNDKISLIATLEN